MKDTLTAEFFYCNYIEILFYKRKAGLIERIYVSFGNQLVGRVHRQHGHSDVHGVDAEVCNKLSNRAASAYIHCAEFSRLPDYAVILEYIAKPAHIFGVGVVCRAFTPCARIFGYSRAAVDKGCVSIFEIRGKSRVVTCGNVGGNSL